MSVEPRNDGGEIIADIMALDKAIDNFLDDLRTRASWDKVNVDDDGTVILPCGSGVLYRLGCAREAMGKHIARHFLKASPPQGDAT